MFKLLVSSGIVVRFQRRDMEYYSFSTPALTSCLWAGSKHAKHKTICSPSYNVEVQRVWGCTSMPRLRSRVLREWFCNEKFTSLCNSVLRPLPHASVALYYCGDRAVPHAIYFVISKKWTAWHIKAADNIHVPQTDPELSRILRLFQYQLQFVTYIPYVSLLLKYSTDIHNPYGSCVKLGGALRCKIK
jgi:hypothetical protein